jgi:hypothetical protein
MHLSLVHRRSFGMRVGLGILSILICIAIILFVAFSGPGGGYVPTVLKAGASGQSQASQISGRDDNGMTAQASIVLDEKSSGGRLQSLTVRTVVPTGPMATVYGLMPGDEITEVGQMKVRDGNNDGELMKALVYEAYQRNQSLVVIRGGQELQLNPNSPLTAAHPNLFNAPGAVPTGNNNTSAQPGSTAGQTATPGTPGDPNQQRIRYIPENVPTH